MSLQRPRPHAKWVSWYFVWNFYKILLYKKKLEKKMWHRPNGGEIHKLE